MLTLDRNSIPESVGRGTLDPELEQWLPRAPTLGADVSIAQVRRDLHRAPSHSEDTHQFTERCVGVHPRRWVSPTEPLTSSRCRCGSSPKVPASSCTQSTTSSRRKRSTRRRSTRSSSSSAGCSTTPTTRASTRTRSRSEATPSGGNMTCVIALKLRDERGPELALQVPLFPEAAFPGDTVSGKREPYGALPRDQRHLRDGAQPRQELRRRSSSVGFPQFTRYSKACHTATEALARLIKQRIG